MRKQLLENLTICKAGKEVGNSDYLADEFV